MALLHFHVECAHLPVVVNCRLALRDVFPRFQKSTPVPKVDLWIFPTQLSWSCLCWMSSFASWNSRQQSYVLILVLLHDFSLNYPPPSPPSRAGSQAVWSRVQSPPGDTSNMSNYIIQYVCVRVAEACIALLLFEHDPPHRRKETAAALPSVFHAHHPAKLAFVPYPLPSSFLWLSVEISW